MSAGVAVFPDHGQNFEALLANADAAMYRAKRAGGGVQFYDVADQSFDCAPSVTTGASTACPR